MFIRMLKNYANWFETRELFQTVLMFCFSFISGCASPLNTRNQTVARIADRTASQQDSM